VGKDTTKKGGAIIKLIAPHGAEKLLAMKK
jgi:hypothetical protein